MLIRARTIAVLAGASLLLITSVARADDADVLFGDAMALVGEERFAEAIPKLEEAQRLDPGVGTQFNLAACYAKVGRLAAAWRNFVEVERLARAAGKKPREDAAHAMLEELRPRVPHLTLRIVDSASETVTIRIDGEVVSPVDYAFVALEPGDHTIQAVGASKTPFETTIFIQGEGEEREIVIPKLTLIESKTEVRTVTRETTNTRRTLGFVFGGLGIAGAATAAVTGIMILSDKSTADEHCKPDCITPSGDPDTTGNDAVRRGKTLIPINLVAWGVAALGLGAGAFFLLSGTTKSQQPRQAGVWFSPAIFSNGAYSTVTTTF